MSVLEALGEKPRKVSVLSALGDDSLVVRSHVRRRSSVARDLVQSGVEALPAMGGVAGGLLGAAGGPAGAIGGAGLGGMAGQAARLALRPLTGLSDVAQPPSVGEQATSIAGAGLGQAGAEAGGQVLSGAARMTGRALMRAALAPTRAMRQEFPKLAQTAVESGEVVGSFPRRRFGGFKIEGGAPAINRLRERSVAQADALLQTANANGVRVPLQDIAQPLIDNADAFVFRTQGRHITGGEAAYILGQVRDEVSNRLGRQGYGALATDVSLLTPEQVQVLKQETQTASKGMFKARRAGVVPAGNPDLTYAIAQAAQKQIGERMPEVAAQNSTTQRLIGLNRAMIQRESGELVEGEARQFSSAAARTAAYGTLAGLGGGIGALSGGTPAERVTHGLEGMALGATLGSPQALSLAALFASNPGLAMLLSQTPRLAGQAVQGWQP